MNERIELKKCQAEAKSQRHDTCYKKGKLPYLAERKNIKERPKEEKPQVIDGDQITTGAEFQAESSRLWDIHGMASTA